MNTNQTEVTLIREEQINGEWEQVTYELEVYYEVIEAEHDVGINADVNLEAVSVDGKPFALTDSEHEWVSQQVYDREYN